MSDGQWRTLEEIAAFAGATTQGASARLRDLRKAHHGGHTVDKRRLRPGLYAYRLTLRPAKIEDLLDLVGDDSTEGDWS